MVLNRKKHNKGQEDDKLFKKIINELFLACAYDPKSIQIL